MLCCWKGGNEGKQESMAGVKVKKKKRDFMKKIGWMELGESIRIQGIHGDGMLFLDLSSCLSPSSYEVPLLSSLRVSSLL
jgi:hypothetical protein